MTRAATTAQYCPPETGRELVLAWIRRAREAQFAHYEIANILSRRDKWLGLPVMLITAVVGTSVFASISSVAVTTEQKIAVGLLSVLAAVLSSLQTFFKFSERSEKHRTAAARFSAIRRKLEMLYVEEGGAQEKSYLNTIRDELDQLAEDSPNVPVHIYQRVQKHSYYASAGSNAPVPGT